MAKIATSATHRIGRWRLREPLAPGIYGPLARATDDRGHLGALTRLEGGGGEALSRLVGIGHAALPLELDRGTEPLPFFVQEIPTGDSLDQVEIDPDELPPLIATLADALAAAHAVGVIHGDVRTRDVIVGPGGTTLAGFGRDGEEHRPAGEVPSAASDVHALGRLVFTEAAGRSGLEWLVELADQMSASSPSARPTAAKIVDLLESRGFHPKQPDAAWFRRRARTLHVPREQLDLRMAEWLENGGAMAICGPRGSGRTHALDRVASTLADRHLTWVRFTESRHSWGGVERALRALAGGWIQFTGVMDRASQADAVATRLVRASPSRLTIVVDDFESVDACSAAVVANLARSARAEVVLTCHRVPDWVTTSIALDPLDDTEAHALLTGLLGDGGVTEDLASVVRQSAEGLPARLVDWVVGAAHRGELIRLGRAWRVSEQGLRARSRGPVAPELGQEAFETGCALAFLGVPEELSELALITGLDLATTRRAVRELLRQDLVRVRDEVVRCANPSAATWCQATCPNPIAVHATLVTHLAGLKHVPWARLGWHLAGAQDRDRIREWGRRVVEGAIEEDAPEAARIADALWSLVPEPELGAARIEALLAARRFGEARQHASAVLGRSPTLQVPPSMLVALARVFGEHGNDYPRAIDCITRARQGEPSIRLQLLEARIHLEAGHLTKAIRSAWEGTDGPPPTSQPDLDHWLETRGIWARALRRAGSRSQALDVIEEIPVEAGSSSPARARLDVLRARLLLDAGRVEEGTRLLLEAAAADSPLPSMERARLLREAGALQKSVGARFQADETWQQALQIYRRLGATGEQARVQLDLCSCNLELCCWEEAARAGNAAMESARTLGDPEIEGLAAARLGTLNLAREDWDEAQRLYGRAGELATALPSKALWVEVTRRQAEIAVLRGAADALVQARHAVRVAEGTRDAFAVGRAQAVLATCLGQAGDHAGVDSLLAASVEPLRRAGATEDLAEVRLWSARALLAMGRQVEAADEASKVLLYANEFDHHLLRTQADALANSARLDSELAPSDDRLSRVLDLAVKVARVRDLSMLLDAIASAARELLDTDRAFVILKGLTGEYEIVAESYRDGVSPGRPSMSVVQRAISGGREVIAAEMEERGDLRRADSVMSLRLDAVLCVPMVDGGESQGAIYVDSRLATGEQYRGAVDVMRALAAHAAIAVANARLIAEREEQARRAARIAHDLRKPIAAILTAVMDVRDNGGVEGWVRDALDDTLDAGRQALSLAETMAEDRTDDLERIDITLLTSRQASLLTHDARRRGVTLDLRLAPGAWVVGNAIDLGRALSALVTFAIRRSHHGGVVDVSLLVRPETLVWRVRDTGPPLAAEGTVDPRGNQPPEVEPALVIASGILSNHGGVLTISGHPEGGVQLHAELPNAGGAC